MKEVNIYMDEWGNPNVDNNEGFNKYFCIGAAICIETIGDEDINRAFSDLKNRENLNDNDQDTIKRGHFHACEDGPEAHSALTYLVNELNLEFSFFKFNKEEYNNNSKPGNFNTERLLHHHMVELASIISTHYDINKVNIYVAERQKSFTASFEDMWINSFYDNLIESSVLKPMLVTNFPEINLEVVEGSNPGVQIADYLLWSTARNYILDKNTWFDRINKKSSADINISSDPLGNIVDFTINNGIKQLELLSQYNISTDDIDELESKLDDEKLFGVFYFVEDNLKKFFENSNDKYIYLQNYLSDVENILNKNEGIKSKEIIELAKGFIMILDTTNIYKDFSQEEMIYLRLVKRIICKIIAGREVSWLDLVKFWRINHKNIKDNL